MVVFIAAILVPFVSLLLVVFVRNVPVPFWRQNSAMLIRVKNGLDIPLAGAADTTVIDAKATQHVALVGSDYPNLKPSLAIMEGQRVRAGETLFSDRQCPAIRVTAPASGIVRQIALRRGHRLERIVIEVNDASQLNNDSPIDSDAQIDNDPPIEWERFADEDLTTLPADVVRERVLESGYWPAIRARPFEGIPSSDIEPRAIFITAIDTNPLAPDPLATIDQGPEDFRRGVAVLARLSEGPTYICSGAHQKVPLPDSPTVSHVQFAGPHPAGLAGTHIHALVKTIGPAPDVWHIGYQDVMAIGRLFVTGRTDTRRVVALCGPGSLSPRLVRVGLGADLAELTRDETRSACHAFSGSILAGHCAPGFLGRYHNQVTLMPKSVAAPAWLSRFGNLLHRHKGRKIVASEAIRAGRSGMLPLESFERVWPYATSPSALLRTLLIGDSEAALEIGCLGLAEEDLALCNYVCSAKIDYGAALRRVLRAMERNG